MKKSSAMKKALAVLLVLTMVLGMGSMAFAATPAPAVQVSVTANNFNPDGTYNGNGVINAKLPTQIDHFSVDLDTVQFYIDDLDMQAKRVYLPADAADPMNGQASVLDAITSAVWENYAKVDESNHATVIGGWDSWTTPNGGYISNMVNYPLTTNATTYFKGENGNKWGRSTGTGWNIAYQTADGQMIKAEGYASNIVLEDGMEIIFDVSPYDMTWDTGAAWIE